MYDRQNRGGELKQVLKLVIGLSALAFVQTALAQEQDPDWPCEQRKVDEISIGQMWPYEIADGELSDDAAKLASILGLRRVTLDEAKVYVEDYASAHPDTVGQDVGLVFEKLLGGINRQRGRLIAGITRYADGQQARAAEIDALRQAMRAEEAKEEPDFDMLDEMETNIDWDERIFKDREHSLSYVCETPVLLEKRAYAIAQILAPYRAE